MVDSILLVPPELLSVAETGKLARYNADVHAGHLFDEETRRRMRILQMRFNWLGWTDTRGGTHAGNRAHPTTVLAVHPKRRRPWQREWWQLP